MKICVSKKKRIHLKRNDWVNDKRKASNKNQIADIFLKIWWRQSTLKFSAISSRNPQGDLFTLLLIIEIRDNSCNRSEQTFHPLLTSPLPYFHDTVWLRGLHSNSSSYNHCLYDHFGKWIIWESIMMNPRRSRLERNIRIWSDCSTILILILHMTSPKIVLWKIKRWIIRQSIQFRQVCMIDQTLDTPFCV